MSKRSELSALLACAAAWVQCVGETPELFPDPEPPPFGSGGALDGAFASAGAGPNGGANAAPVAAVAGGDGSGTAANAPSSEAGPSGVLPVGSMPPAPGQPSGMPAAVEPAAELDPTGGARLCPLPAQTLLLDFEVANNGPSQALFGGFQGQFSGGTYFYPVRPSEAPAEPVVFGLASDVTAGDWFISGTVSEPAGFGLFLDCQLLDASRFDGIAFRIGGSIEPGGELIFQVGTASNEVSRAWFQQNGNPSPAPSFGRCFPAQSQFDGSCQAPLVTLPIAAGLTEVVVRFADLAGGSPSVSLNAAEITTIAWALPELVTADGGVVPYVVDLHVDDIRFVELP